MVPTIGPELRNPSVQVEALGAASGEARPQLAIDQNGDVHLLWLDQQGREVALKYRQWTSGGGWLEDTATLYTWQSTRPLTWDFLLDQAGTAHVVWAEPGEIYTLTRNTAGGVQYNKIPVAVAGSTGDTFYKTTYGAALAGNTLYIIYRDDDESVEVPNYRLAYPDDADGGWQTSDPIIADPSRPTNVTQVSVGFTRNGVTHLLIGVPGDPVYLQHSPDTEQWRGLATGQDTFVGNAGRDLVFDERNFPGFLLVYQGGVYFRQWNGTAWAGSSEPLLNAGSSLNALAVAMAPDDVVWVLGQGERNEQQGLWMRTFKGEDASDPNLLLTGRLTESDIAIDDALAHIVAVVDGELWHINIQTSFGSGLPRQRLVSPDAGVEEEEGN
jgi:hypothetical protein